MTAVAPLLEAFFSDRLARQREASPNTVAAYRDGLRLLLRFVNDRTGKPPSKLDFTDLDAPTIGAFLEHLEVERGNSVVTRNSRLAALRSFFSYAALSCPEHAGLIQRVLAIPEKRTDRATVCFLTHAEVDALLTSPDRSTWIGRRDHALLVVAAQTGLRVSELTGLRIQDAHLETGAHVWCRQGPQGPLHPVDCQDHLGTHRVDARTPRRTRRPTVPQPWSWPRPLEPGLSRVPGPQARRRRS